MLPVKIYLCYLELRWDRVIKVFRLVEISNVIVGTLSPHPTPHTPPLLKGVWDLPKIESLGGGGINLFARKWGWYRNGGGLPLFYYFTVQSHLLCLGGKQSSLNFLSDLQSFELAMQDSHPTLNSTKTLYHLYIFYQKYWLLYLN